MKEMSVEEYKSYQNNKSKSKYKNHKLELDGHIFDSKKRQRDIKNLGF